MNQYFVNNNNLKSEEKVINYHYNSFSFTFLSDNGVFSKNKIDYASKLLIETYLKEKHDIHNFLDVGCGYGFLSIVLSKVLNIKGLGIDINKRALKLANKNNTLNESLVTYIESDIYNKVNDKYDLIITNPPIRAGKNIVLTILKDASKYLNEEGELWFVINKNQGAKSIIKEINSLYKIEIKEKSNGFYIFLAKKN